VIFELGGWSGANNPTVKLIVCYETLHAASDQDGLFDFAHDRDLWRAVVSAVMNLRVLAPRS
jgi:hypothetical protein